MAAAGLAIGWHTCAAAAVANPVKAYEELLLQQSPTGLIGNQEKDDLSGVYTNVLGSLCLGARDGQRHVTTTKSLQLRQSLFQVFHG